MIILCKPDYTLALSLSKGYVNKKAGICQMPAFYVVLFELISYNDRSSHFGLMWYTVIGESACS